MALNIVALMMLICVTAFVIYIICFLGALPGRVARQRNHPQADAIRITGWLGLLTGGIVWCGALVWAFMVAKPGPAAARETEPVAAD